MQLEPSVDGALWTSWEESSGSSRLLHLAVVEFYIFL